MDGCCCTQNINDSHNSGFRLEKCPVGGEQKGGGRTSYVGNIEDG